jgi:flagellum-specific peptidoglycan hydrolase FlgJ
MGSKKQIIGFLALIATLFLPGACKQDTQPEPEKQTVKIYPHEDSNATGPIWEHIRQNHETAHTMHAFYNVPACISLAQAILESGGGTSYLAQKNNFFGHRSFPIDEQHYYKGQSVSTESGNWRTYETPAEAYEEHARFFLHTRQWIEKDKKFKYPYRHLCDGRHWKEWIKGLEGYAGDKDYGQRLEQIINKYRLTEYNYTGEPFQMQHED